MVNYGRKYIRIPETVIAMQWMKHGDHPDVVRLDSMGQGGYSGYLPPPFKLEDLGKIYTNSTSGWEMIYPGDWIITEATGRISLCRKDVFELTYLPKEPTADIASGGSGSINKIINIGPW